MARNITLSPTVAGDTWNGLTQCRFSSDGTAFADSLATVRAQWRDSTGTAALTLSSANSGEITINDASTWEFEIPARVLSLAVGIYSFGLETTDSAGIIKTRITATHEILTDPVI